MAVDVTCLMHADADALVHARQTKCRALPCQLSSTLEQAPLSRMLTLRPGRRHPGRRASLAAAPAGALPQRTQWERPPAARWHPGARAGCGCGPRAARWDGDWVLGMRTAESK